MATRPKLKVLWSVVVTNAVSVVDRFVRKQLPAKCLLHHKAMFGDAVSPSTPASKDHISVSVTVMSLRPLMPLWDVRAIGTRLRAESQGHVPSSLSAVLVYVLSGLNELAAALARATWQLVSFAPLVLWHLSPASGAILISADRAHDFIARPPFWVLGYFGETILLLMVPT